MLLSLNEDMSGGSEGISSDVRKGLLVEAAQELVLHGGVFICVCHVCAMCVFLRVWNFIVRCSLMGLHFYKKIKW